ncbi:MAG: 2OG-Fe(II) oxygenase [Planctomycetaceae bacterium]|nr:2OG-Fe(II) oxygenase [Planctomycetaceae bacterium]
MTEFWSGVSARAGRISTPVPVRIGPLLRVGFPPDLVTRIPGLIAFSVTQRPIEPDERPTGERLIARLDRWSWIVSPMVSLAFVCFWIHQDFPFERDNGERSFLTFMIYLNDDFEGGETSFEDSYSDEPFDPFSVVPQTGMALFFEHGTYHIGELVSHGRKYVLRTDVMYAADDAGEWEEQADDHWNDEWGE